MQPYSEITGKTYESFEALVAAEAHGYVVTAVVTRDGKTWPWHEGLYATKKEADNAKARAKARWAKTDSQYPTTAYKFYVRPLWKDRRDLT